MTGVQTCALPIFIIVFPEVGKLYGNATKLKEYPVTGSGVTDGVGVFVGVFVGVDVIVGVGVFVGVSVGVGVGHKNNPPTYSPPEPKAHTSPDKL